MLEAINIKNERNNESSLPNWISHFSHFFHNGIRIQIEFARPHASDIYPDYFCYPGLLWEYWKLSMRRGGHLEYNIHGTTYLGIFEFSVHTIPGSQCIQKFPLWRADSCGRKSNPEIRVDESTVQYFYKSPLRGSSDLIYKIEQRRRRKRLICKSNC